MIRFKNWKTNEKSCFARFRGHDSSQEIEESRRDCDLAVLITLEFDDNVDHFDDSDDPSDCEQPKYELYYSRDGPSVEEFAEPGDKEQNHTVENLVYFVH